MAEPIRVEAPDALLGFLLAQRLPQLEADVRAHGQRWEVEITAAGRDPEELVPDLLATVRRWLRDERLEATTVYVEGRALRISASDEEAPLA